MNRLYTILAVLFILPASICAGEGLHGPALSFGLFAIYFSLHSAAHLVVDTIERKK
jgi:hypothetical protein